MENAMNLDKEALEKLVNNHGNYVELIPLAGIKNEDVGDINSKERGSGARYNQGKAEFSLIPMTALEDCARVFMYGRDKYAAWNWAKGMDWLIPYDCMMRHMEAWQRGETKDPESGLPHLAHALCNLIMLSLFSKSHPKGDNRPTNLGIKKER
jgi:hypothetical protein